MNKPLFTHFLRISHDFLMMLNDKLKRADLNQTIKKESDTLQAYYNEVEALFMKYEERDSEIKLTLLNERIKSKLMEKELAALIKASINRDEKEIDSVIKKSSFEVSNQEIKKGAPFKKRTRPTEKQMAGLKTKFKSGVPLNEILTHFILNEKQLIEIIDQ